jgi:hypothetical protein
VAQATLWHKPLDEIDLSTQQGQADLIARFMIREGKASTEKDELIAFVERNRSSIPPFVENVLQPFLELMDSDPQAAAMAAVARYFCEQVELAYQGDVDAIQTRSDRTFWLMFVLGAKLGSGGLSYVDAVAYLRKPVHRARITRTALQFMVHDFVESIGEPNQPATEMLMLIGEAACLAGEIDVVKRALLVVLKLGTARDSKNLMTYVRRQQEWLTTHGQLDPHFQDPISRITGRYGSRVAPEDF